MEDSYKIGDEAFYHEVGEVDRVRVLENKSDVDFIKYKLEVLEVLREGELFDSEIVGAKFECRKQRDFSGNGELWSLRDKFREE